ncbi:MAG TPA: CobD/CbiB family protein [Noviherbaspirillum sp.]|nr:CobD/CbiB family protein [Noviherbaspirillum sp.]
MTFLSILVALLIEQVKPLRADNPVYAAVRQFSVRMERSFNAGEESHGRVAWLLTVGALLVPTLILYWICAAISPFAVLVFNVVVVYLTLGFRHYSHYFTSIQLALNSGDEATARRLLAEWTKEDTAALGAREIARVAVENALVTTHRNVFGVFFWLLLPFGPAGAVLYRLSEHLARSWNEPAHLRHEPFGRFATRMFYWIDWIPARLTAIAFAIVGNFEDAIYAWRNFAHRWKDEAIGIILSAGGGALGLRLGNARETAVDLAPADPILEATAGLPDSPPGEEATARALQSTVGLLWRALLLWMLLLLLASVAAWMG